MGPRARTARCSTCPSAPATPRRAPTCRVRRWAGSTPRRQAFSRSAAGRPCLRLCLWLACCPRSPLPAGCRLVSESEEHGDLPEGQEGAELCNAQPYPLPDAVRRKLLWAPCTAGHCLSGRSCQPGIQPIRPFCTALHVHAGGHRALPSGRRAGHARRVLAAPTARHRHRCQQPVSLLDPWPAAGSRAAPQAAACGGQGGRRRACQPPSVQPGGHGSGRRRRGAGCL